MKLFTLPFLPFFIIYKKVGRVDRNGIVDHSTTKSQQFITWSNEEQKKVA